MMELTHSGLHDLSGRAGFLAAVLAGALVAMGLVPMSEARGSHAAGHKCSPACDYDMRIRGIEVTQAVQQSALTPFDLRSGPTAGITRRYPLGIYRGVPLAARGLTLVRVFPWVTYPRPISIPGTFAILRGYRFNGAGRALTPLGSITNLNGPQTVTGGPGSSELTYAERTNPAGAIEFTVPIEWLRRSGFVRLVVELQPPPNTRQLSEVVPDNNIAGVSSIPLTETRDYRLEVVAMNTTDRAGGMAPPGTSLFFDWFGHLRALLPLGDTQLRLPPDYVGTIDVTPIARCNQADQMAGACSAGANVDAQLTAALARWAAANPVSGQPFGLTGRTFGGGRAAGGVAISATDDRPLTSVAHEVGHLLGRPHAGNAASCYGGQQVGEPWPPDMRGRIGGIGFDRRHGSGLPAGTWRILAPGENGMNPENTDWMSYCTVNEASQWISVRNWTTLLTEVFRVGAPSPTRGVGVSRAPTTASGRTLAVYASVEHSGRGDIIAVDPGRLPPSAPARDSRFRLVARDAAGRVLEDLPVTAEVFADRPNLLFVAANLRAIGAQRIELLRDGEVIAHRDRSGRAPRVDVTDPARNARVLGSGDVAVRWRATDADGNPVSATVEYSADNGRRYRTLTVLATGGRAQLPAYLFSASRSARVRVTVNDGFNEAAAVSAPFRSAGRPPRALILYPKSGTRVANDAPLVLGGQAFDDAGHPLGGRQVSWHLGRRLLGRGESIAVSGLPPGRRRIVMQARDRLRRVGRVAVTVRLAAVPPAFLALRAPARIGRRATAVALRVAASRPATLRVRGRSYRVGPRTSTVRVPVPRGRRPLVVPLHLTANGKVNRRTVTIAR